MRKVLTYFKKRLQDLFLYVRSHIWIELIGAVFLFILVVVLIMQDYLKHMYLDYLMDITLQTETAMLNASAANLDEILERSLELGGQIAIDKKLRSSVEIIREENGEAVTRDVLSLNSYLSGLTYYSNDIAAVTVVDEKGPLLEYGRYWYGSATHNLWENEQLDILNELYEEVMGQLDRPQVGRYAVSALPTNHDQLPNMQLFHIAFPLIGKSSSFEQVESVVVVSFKLNNVIQSSSIKDEVNQANVQLYLKDDKDVIIYCKDKSKIGLTEQEFFKGKNYTMLRQPLKKFNWVETVAIDNANMKDDVNRIYRQAIIVYLVMLLICYLCWQFLMHHALKPVGVIKEAMEDIKSGKKEQMIQVEGHHEIWQLATHYNEMLTALQEQRSVVKQQYEEKAELIKLQSKAEQHALESQINAHFLCNTLNAINYDVMESGNDEVSVLLKNLSNIVRYSFAQKSGDVTVGIELDWLRQYLFLQKYRLMDKFDYEIDFPEEYNDWPCCKLFLQPFVENSIIHGFENMDSGGMIQIIGEAKGGYLNIRIVDNGCGMPKEMCRRIEQISNERHELSLEGRGNGIGISNVLTRMKMFYGDGFSYHVSSIPGIKTQFELVLPIPPMNV